MGVLSKVQKSFAVIRRQTPFSLYYQCGYCGQAAVRFFMFVTLFLRKNRGVSNLSLHFDK